MPGIYSHANRTVSSIWYLVAAFIIALIVIGWKTTLAIQDIDMNNRAMVSQMQDLMISNQPR